MADMKVENLEHIDAPRRPKPNEIKKTLVATKVIDGVKYVQTKDILAPRYDADLKHAIDARSAERVFVGFMKSEIIDEQKLMRDAIDAHVSGSTATGSKRGLKASDFAA